MWQSVIQSLLFYVNPHTRDRRINQGQIEIFSAALFLDQDVLSVIDFNVVVILRELRLECITDGSRDLVLARPVFLSGHEPPWPRHRRV